ncbi:AGAP007964-PA-like protein [Anopheles sinensis]|uniref:AGAP007964-PA-like protein n=1 Tax=Anopheles sinensis TaxID=74873 RepID=A0A084WHB4_ANOSI|nr:AGAP007964-PA-like protein [Anopheles sinensis]
MMKPKPERTPVQRENNRPDSVQWAVPVSAKLPVPETTKSVVPVSAKPVESENTIIKQVPKQKNNQPYLGRATCDHTNETVAPRTNSGSEKDWINMLSLPPNVMNLSSKIVEPDLSTFATRGSIVKLYVLNVFNPNRIWVRCSFHMAMFRKLQEELAQEYTYSTQDYERSLYLTKETAQRGLYCAARWEGSWYRAKIVGPLMGDSVKLNLIDLGLIEMVDISQLRYLASIFSKPEVLVVRASLAYLVPRKHFWRRADSDHLQKMLVNSELFSATIVNYDEVVSVA